MGFYRGPNIVRDGLIVHYDAASKKSYPGTGTTWYDLSGNGYNVTLNSASIWSDQGQQSFMDFENGIAKYLPGGSLTNIPGTDTPAITIIIFSTIKLPDGDWKTLVRGDVSRPDHQIIINSGDGVSLGMYDNDAAGFQDTGFDVSSISNRENQFNYMVWKLNTSSPYYQFFYNDYTYDGLSSSQATLTTSNATHNSGFSSIGGYHNGSNSPTSFSQEFGRMSVFMCYGRHLSESEIRQNYNALYLRFKP